MQSAGPSVEDARRSFDLLGQLFRGLGRIWLGCFHETLDIGSSVEQAMPKCQDFAEAQDLIQSNSARNRQVGAEAPSRLADITGHIC